MAIWGVRREASMWKGTSCFQCGGRKYLLNLGYKGFTLNLVLVYALNFATLKQLFNYMNTIAVKRILAGRYLLLVEEVQRLCFIH